MSARSPRGCSPTRDARSSVSRTSPADGIADLAEGSAIGGVDAIKVAHVIFRQIGHFCDSAVHAAIVPVIDEAIVDTGVVAQAITSLQTRLRLPGSSRRFHAVDGGGGNCLCAACRAAIEIKLHIRSHVLGRGIDGSGGTLDDRRV